MNLIRFLIPLLFLLSFDYYIFSAVCIATENFSTVVQSVIRTFFWMIPLALIFVLYQGVATIGTSMGKNKWDFLLKNSLIGAYIGKLIIAVLLTVDLVRRMVMSMVAWMSGSNASEYLLSKEVAAFSLLVGIGFMSLLIYGMLRNRYRYKIHRTKVYLKNLPADLEGLKIVQISDIHSGSFTEIEPIEKGVELMNKENADLVFFTGDLVNNIAEEMEPFIPVFKKIKAKRGVFSILGNHDYGDYVQWKSTEHKLKNFQDLLRTHRSLGWDLLLNENRILTFNKAKLAIVGVENYSAKGRFSKYGDLSRAFSGSERADVKLLLSHDPSHWLGQVVPEFKDIDITFSGHTHGMQFGIDIPGWFQWSPIQYVYKQWAGLYKEGEQYLYVNRGFGFLGYPGRVGVLAEITVMELTGKE